MFGFEVDADFMEKHYEDIQKMLSGTAEEAEKAYKRIMKNNLIDALTKNFGSSMTTTQIDSWAEHIANLDPGEAMDAAWTTHLMNMINSGNYTKEELEYAKRNPAIIHYAGVLGKPWHRKRPPDEYQKYVDVIPKKLKRKTFRDWRKTLFSKI